jgi:hypothetical protein
MFIAFKIINVQNLKIKGVRLFDGPYLALDMAALHES